MSRPSRRQQHEAGFTLVEVLVTVAILGIGVVAVVGGMMTSIKVSAAGQSAAETQLALRADAQSVAAAAYVDCASVATYQAAASSVTAVSYLTSGDALTAAFGSTCPSDDDGIQRVTLSVTAADGTTSSLVLVKRRAA